jgi:pimeloyl-ACP methyl ester carboxylesterase
MAPMFAAPAEDLLTELHVEETFDSRPVLPQIRVPVLLIGGDQDRCFSAEVLTETAALIPHCTLIWYRGKGHSETVASSRVARDVLDFATA